ncbi:MAG: CBS domain-containing protein [Ruminococcaceae bacterium]|nr:CBS domain-containing protein [Oscillospiraceae bacterium]
MNIIKLLKPKCSVAYLTNDQSVRQGLEKMKYHGYTAIPVIDSEGRYISTVTEGDFLWSITEYESTNLKDLERIPITNIIRMDWNPAIKINAPFEALISHITERNFVPVVDDRDVFIGIITRKEVMRKHFESLLENKFNKN